MSMIVKSFRTYVPLGNLGLSSREVCFPLGNLGLSSGEVCFPLGNNHVLGEKDFKLPPGAI